MKLTCVLLLISSSLFAQLGQEKISTSYVITDTLTVKLNAEILLKNDSISIFVNKFNITLCSKLDVTKTIQMNNRVWYKAIDSNCFISYVEDASGQTIGVFIPNKLTYYYSTRPTIN